MVYPALGRLAFLLEFERVRLHWLAEGDDNDWTGLASDNAVNEAGQEARPLPLKANDWNQLRLTTTADRVKIELNGGVIYERKLKPDNPRTFGLFHYKDRTAVQVRNVVLTGDWPEKLSEKDQTGLLAPLPSPPKEGEGKGEADGATRRALIGDKFFLLNAGRVLRQTRAAKSEEAYALLLTWVLPNENHTVFQMSGEFTPADPAPPVAPAPPAGRRVQTGGELEAPALELVALAKKLGKLDELAERVQKASVPGQERERLAMLALVRGAQERDDQARTALAELTWLVTPLPPTAPIWMRWPELVAASGTMSRPALRGAALALLDVLVRHMEQAMQQQIPLPDRDTWVRRVRQARSAALVLGLPAEQRATFGADPGLKYWDPVSFNRAMPRGIGAPLTHWSLENGVVRHYPGRAQDHLYLRMPLRGDFEVNCELTTFGWREGHLAYGGLRFDLIYTLKTFDLHSFDRRIRVGQIEPPLKPPGDWYKMRLVVRDGTWTVYVNDRKMCEEPLPDEADPWLMLHADHQITAGIRNLKITGQPRVPEALALSALPDLTGWRSYDDSSWEKRGDTIISHGHRTRNDNVLGRGPKTTPQPRTWQERALHYNRPLLEDGEVEYDFFYEPNKFHGHPALDRLVFLLDPEGVRIHWLTDGIHDRTGLHPDNATTEPKNRRGPAKLPLKPKAWNHLKLVLAGETVTLDLNGVEIHQRALESTNQRTFGLFHYADDTTMRVRNVTYRGRWPRQLPGPDELWARKDSASK
jgi:hypothetical protein